jgi:cytochrome c oxidase cbb3-type subunit 3
MCAKPIKDDTKTKVGTTGHSWDGIEELNTPLPRWWLWTFYLTILFAIGYTIAYPA